jgi:hypothetical protein
MNHEAESSRAPQRHDDSSHADPDDAIVDVDVDMDIDEEADEREREKLAKERRLDAKRKRIRMLNELLRDLDMVVYMELITLYYFEYGQSLCAKTIANRLSTAALSFGWPSKASFMGHCSHPSRTLQPSTARQTFRNRSSLCSFCRSASTSSCILHILHLRLARTPEATCMGA